jgi:hypothetical protein
MIRLYQFASCPIGLEHYANVALVHVVQVQISLAVPKREQVELRGQVGDDLHQQLLGRRVNLVVGLID